MKKQKTYWKEALRQPLTFLRVLFGALKCGSWQLSKEIESERVLFPKAYELRKQKEVELRRWVKLGTAQYELQKQKGSTKK